MVAGEPEKTPPIVAFSAEQVADLTGLSKRQIAHWDRAGFYQPHFGSGTPGAAYGRAYSFRDVVNLRVLAILRNQHRVPLQRLRAIGQYLSKDGDQPWSRVTFYVVGNKVFFDHEEAQARMSGQKLGQTVVPLPMERVSADMASAIERLRRRAPDQIGEVEQHRHVLGNEPVLAGTRIPTVKIWSLVSGGYSQDQILYQYPSLTPDDIAAAVDYERAKRKQRAS